MFYVVVLRYGFHQYTDTDSVQTLVRGAFTTAADAHAWAQHGWYGVPYHVRAVTELPDGMAMQEPIRALTWETLIPAGANAGA